MKIFQKSTFWLFLIEETDIYHMLNWSHEKILFLAEVITAWRSVIQCNCIACVIFNHVPWKSTLKIYLLLQFLNVGPLWGPFVSTIISKKCLWEFQACQPASLVKNHLYIQINSILCFYIFIGNIFSILLVMYLQF